MYILQFIAPDGETIKDNEFKTIKEALKAWEDIGSKWFFYPFGVITTQKGYIREIGDELMYYKNKNIKTLIQDNVLKDYLF